MSAPKEARALRWEALESESPLPLVQRRKIVGEQAMLSRFELEAGCVVPSHQHQNEQFACVLEGSVRFRVGSPEREEVVRAGGVLHLPAMTPRSAEALEDSVVLDVFAPPSEATGVDVAQAE